jgi:formylglycine-generating enzyme required for sulfatase activity
MIHLLLAVACGVMAFAQKPEFVEIPAGSFIMGCDPAWKCAQSLPKRARRLRSRFLMSKTEVTVGQFRAFVNATGYRTDAEKASEARNWQSPVSRSVTSSLSSS